jgi:glyoxylase-like metal-dependent hydrolase (beta-lactamase superfamily II)
VELAKGFVAVGDESWGEVRAFLVDSGTGLTLVDTLGYEHPFLILAAIRKMGRSISDLKRIWLTHAHYSHLVGLAVLKELSGARVGAHKWEADIVSGERKSQRVPILPRPPYKVYYPFQFGQAFNLRDHTPCAVDDCLRDGDSDGRLTVVHAPGHTPGHLAFWSEDDGILLAGDAIVTWPCTAAGWESFTLNAPQQRASVRRLADLKPAKVGVGHGDPITEDAAEIVNCLAGKREAAV